jgi:hypothetical protein
MDEGKNHHEAPHKLFTPLAIGSHINAKAQVRE